jgi:hypothetical protein
MYSATVEAAMNGASLNPSTISPSISPGSRAASRMARMPTSASIPSVVAPCE